MISKVKEYLTASNNILFESATPTIRHQPKFVYEHFLKINGLSSAEFGRHRTGGSQRTGVERS
jgi:hypothetical protein